MATSILSLVGDPTPTTLVLVSVIFLMGVIIAKEFRSWQRLRHIPGPFLNSITVLPLSKLASTGRISHGLKEIQRKYGPLVRIGPSQVMFGDAETYRRMSSVRSEFSKGPWYGAAKVMPHQDSLFTSQEEAYRKEVKTKMTPGYAGKDGAAFEPKVDQSTTELIDLIERKYISTPTDYRPINFAHAIVFFSMDVLGEISFGEAFGFLREDKDLYNYIEINETAFPFLAVMMTIPWFDKVLKSWPLNMAAPKDQDIAGFGKLMGLANQIVGKRFEPGAKERDDMLASHIRNGLNRQETLAEIFLELVAGVDSTATAIRMAILFLINNPSSLSALHREIAAYTSSTTCISPIIPDKAAYALPYLQAVIKESIRLHPPATGWMNKQPPPGGAEIHGYFVPEGTQISVNIMYLLHDPKVFGPDSDVFRPERWIDAGEERLVEMNRCLDLSFGYGRYQCMGIKIAWMEINKAVFELVKRFDFAVVNPLEPLKLFDAAFWVCKDFHLRVTKRV